MGHITQKKTDSRSTRGEGQLENVFSMHMFFGNEDTEKLGCKQMFHSHLPFPKKPGSHFPNN